MDKMFQVDKRHVYNVWMHRVLSMASFILIGWIDSDPFSDRVMPTPTQLYEFGKKQKNVFRFKELMKEATLIHDVVDALMCISERELQSDE